MKNTENITANCPEPDRTRRPEPRELQCPPFPEEDVVELPTGVQLHLLDKGEAEVSRLTVMLPGGEAETCSQEMANIAAGMLREGCAAADADTYADRLERDGSWIATTSHPHHRQVKLYTLNRHFDSSLELLTAALLHPTFPQERLELLRERTASTLRTDMCKVNTQANIALRRLVMGEGHPLAETDTPESILQISRDAVAALHARSMEATRQIHIYLAGRLTDRMIGRATDTFGAFPAQKAAMEMQRVPPMPDPSRNKAVVEVPGATQSAVLFAMPLIGREHPDYIPLRTAVTALGGYFGSRLNTVVREAKGLTYSIFASLQGYKTFSDLIIGCQTSPDSVDAVVDAVAAEMRRLATGDFTADELTRLRRNAIASLAATFDTPFSQDDRAITTLVADIPRGYFNDQLRFYENLSAEALTEVSARYLDPDKLYTAVAGPAV